MMSKEKTLSLEEGPIIWRNDNANHVKNQVERSFNRTQCIQLTKLSIYIVTIFFVGWLGVKILLPDNPVSENILETYSTHTSSENDGNINNSKIIPEEDFSQTTIQDEKRVWVHTSSENNGNSNNSKIIPEDDFLQTTIEDEKSMKVNTPHGKMVFNNGEFHKFISSEDTTDSNQDVEVSKKSDESDSSNDKMIVGKDSEMMKSSTSGFHNINNDGNDKDESDSFNDMIASNEHFEKSSYQTIEDHNVSDQFDKESSDYYVSYSDYDY